MARLYSNENFPLPAVEKLRALGHDVLTIQETGKADQAMPDAEVLKFAAKPGGVLMVYGQCLREQAVLDDATAGFYDLYLEPPNLCLN